MQKKYTVKKIQGFTTVFIFAMLAGVVAFFVLGLIYPAYNTLFKIIAVLLCFLLPIGVLFIPHLAIKYGLMDVPNVSGSSSNDKSAAAPAVMQSKGYLERKVEDLIYLFFLAFRAKKRRWWNYLGAGNSHSDVIQDTFVNSIGLYTALVIGIVFRLITKNILAHKAAFVVCAVGGALLTIRFLNKKYPKERVRDIIYEHSQTKKTLSWGASLLFKCFLFGFAFFLCYLTIHT